MILLNCLVIKCKSFRRPNPGCFVPENCLLYEVRSKTGKRMNCRRVHLVCNLRKSILATMKISLYCKISAL
ncbi:hypothetical protein D3C76_1358600 [compost metagenome]